jgi:AcrR family transcriptional regulator
VTGESRKRDSNATKADLLRAAGELFNERGFDRTTVRDIANLAGVNQSLLFRYFGSKEELFHAVLAVQTRELVAESPAEQVLSRTLARMLDTERTNAHNSAWYAALRSSGHESAADAIRRQLGEDYIKSLMSLTDAEDAELRADLVLAWILGLGMLRSVVGKEPLGSADSRQVAEHVLHAVSMLLERIDTTPAS